MKNICCAIKLAVLLVVSFFTSICDAQTIKVPLTSHLEPKIDGETIISYSGDLAVGTPTSQTFRVLFDTTNSYTWLPNQEWLASDEFTPSDHTGYQSVKSESSSMENANSTMENYHGTLMIGKHYSDLLTSLGSNSTIEGNRFNFVLVSDATNDRFKGRPYDGVVGLSPAQQSVGGMENIVVGLKKAGIIAKAEFAFWFDKNINEPSDFGGELTLGGVDTSRYYGNFYYHKLTDDNLWQVALKRVLVNDKDNVDIKELGCYGRNHHVVFDTSFTDISGPLEQVAKLYNILKPELDLDTGLPIIDCYRSGAPQVIRFDIEREYGNDNSIVTYRLWPINYIRSFKTQTGDHKCYLAIKPNKDSINRWVLGTNFLNQYYTRFDMENQQIGFATPLPA